MYKEELINLLEDLLKDEHLDKRSEDLKLVKREYKRIVDREEDSFYEKELTDKAVKLFNELAKKEPSLLLSPYDEKKRIIEAAKKLLDKPNVLAANKELDELTNEFKRAGRCLKKEQDDELWTEFREVQDKFYAKKRAYFEELDKSNAIKRAKKEDIIARAKEITETFKDMREANDKMNALRQEWKEVGYSGKGDDYLWKEFLKVLDEFSDKKKEHHAEMVKMFEERAAKKEEMIKAAKKLLADSDFSDEEVVRVKAMRKEFNAIGFAGKEKDDDLYARFDAVIQKYFEEMKFYKY